MIVFDKHRRARKHMSAYVDGELAANDSEALKSHVETCERCRLELEQLRATVTALQGMPDVAPRRSFALTPDMLKPPRPAPQAGPSPALVQGMRLTAAGLAAALALVFVIDVSDSGTSDDDDATGFFFTPARTDERNTSADVFDDRLAPESAGDGAAPTTIPEQGYEYADVPTPAATIGAGGGGAGGGVGVGGGPDAGGIVDSGDGEATGGEPDADTGDLPLTGEDITTSAGEPMNDPSAPSAIAGDDSIDSDDEEVAEKIADPADGQENGAGSDSGEGQPASLASEDGGGFDTLLALEIGLGVALIATIGGAIWVGAAARRNSIGG